MKSVLIGILSAVAAFIILSVCMGFTNPTPSTINDSKSFSKVADNGIIEIYEYSGGFTRPCIYVFRDKGTGNITSTQELDFHR